MKIVRVKGFGKFNKDVEEVFNQMLNDALFGNTIPKYNPKCPVANKAHFYDKPDELAFAEFIYQAWLRYSGQNPDELAFAE